MLQIQDRVRNVSLKDLFPKGQFVGAPDIQVNSCCGDPRSCQPGDAFFALVGAEDDGHDYVRQAIERGASAVVAERLLPIKVPQCIVRHSHEAYGRVCQALAGDPSGTIRTVGVTGSNGKTVTSLLIASIFKAAKQNVGTFSTLGSSDGCKIGAAIPAFPAAPELADWLARTAANGCENAVLEVSSEGLAQRRMAGMELDAAVVTNLRRDHVDDHGSLLNLRKLKGRVFDHLKPHGFAVLNADDPASQPYIAKINRPAITFGMRARAEIMATVLERHSSEQTFLLTAGNEAIPVRSRMIGDHHVYNCLAAAAVGLVLGVDLPTVVRGLESVDFVPGRMERIECGQDFGVFTDYARTPDALEASLKALRQVTRGRVICVFGAEGDKDHALRPQLGRVVERLSNYNVITNHNPRHDEPLQIVHDILDGYTHPEKAHVLPDRAKAIQWALSQARPGDSVLIAGKGDEDFQHLGSKRHAWDDREIARTWLYEQADASNDKPSHGFRIVG